MALMAASFASTPVLPPLLTGGERLLPSIAAPVLEGPLLSMRCHSPHKVTRAPGAHATLHPAAVLGRSVQACQRETPCVLRLKGSASPPTS